MIMGFDAVTNTWKCLPESPCGAGDRLEVQGDGSVDCIAGDPPAGETMMIFKGGPP